MSSPMIDFPFLSFSISYINMVFLKVISEDLSRPLEKLLAQSTRLLEYQKNQGHLEVKFMPPMKM